MKTGQLTADQLRRVENAIENVPFAKLLGIELEEIDTGVATLGLEIREEFKQNHRVAHGGVIASLIDTATAFAIISLLPADEQATTADLTISYLRPLSGGRARCTATVRRAGRRLIVVSADLWNEAGNLAATALTTYIKL